MAWILTTIMELQLQPPPAVAVMPLGTGNDLSLSFGWGNTFLHKWISVSPISCDCMFCIVVSLQAVASVGLFKAERFLWLCCVCSTYASGALDVFSGPVAVLSSGGCLPVPFVCLRVRHSGSQCS